MAIMTIVKTNVHYDLMATKQEKKLNEKTALR